MAEWVILQKDQTAVGDPAGVPDAIVKILERRGVSKEQADDFFAEMPKTTYDPFKMNDLKEAVFRLLDSAVKGRRICVYGDYDADGVTSTTLLLTVLRHFTDNVRYYIPSRFVDGYGLNNAAIDKLAEDGVEVLVTVDCGSTSLAEIEHAKELGMEVIVTDHHTPGTAAPGCLFVNPKRADSTYPFKDLCGCGVAFKLAQGIVRVSESKGDKRFTRADMNELLDLVAIATVADVVSLLDENRTLVKYGLMYINDHRRTGLNILLDALRLGDRRIGSEDIAYIIAPHINALGRMHSAELGVDLLLGGKPEEDLRKLALSMVENNAERKTVQDDTRKICMEAIEKGGCGELMPVIYAPGAHEGVAGIVAGNLKESLYKPVCIVTPIGDGLLKGTGRSVPGVNMHELFSSCAELFTRFGGHAGACGFTLPEENLDAFRNAMQEEMRKRLDAEPELLTEKLYIEKVLSSGEKNVEFAEMLAKLEPFGEANEKPLFCMKNAGVVSTYYLGQEQQHLRFTVMTGDSIPVECILFRRAAEFSGTIYRGASVDVAGELTVNEYNGRRLQMVVRDIKGA
ncbi:MAG: single-stranded-DNA-specific exonuclease RecJ [Firmicutes bacterium]|nr:single-stranded-DNA-specific exonuclease RecJ [Bacillota bacterium]MBR6351899.1 single-stranded-DNA-specific exonuclease RecJ [Bacillota bacterium]